MSQSSRPNFSLFSFPPTTNSSVSSSTGLGSSVNSVNPRLNLGSSILRGHQQREPTIFNRRINSCVEQTPDTNNGVSPSSILSSRLNTNTSYRLTPNVANAARVHPTTFSTLPRLNHNNISTTSSPSTSSASTNNMNLAALETQITEMMNHLNDLKLQFSSLNRPQQTQTPLTASSPNPTQLPTPTTTISTTTSTGTTTFYSNTLFANDTPSTSTSATTTTPTTTLPLLSDVLQHFQCPFEHDPELLCGYYERHTEGGVCPFGHLLDAFNAGVELTNLPSSYLCLNHLLDECTNQLIEGQVSQLVRCSDGLHLRAAELVDSKRLQEMLASEVLTTDAQWQQRQQAMEEVVRNCLEMVCGFGAGTSRTTEDAETEEAAETVEASAPLASTTDAISAAATPTEEPDCCSICHTEFTSVAAFGLLENCDHPFCADCILTWHQHQKDQPGFSNVQTSSCPYCRVESARLVLWPEGRIESAEQKRAVFELQHRAVRLWSTSAPAAATTARQTLPATPPNLPTFRETAAAVVVEPEPEEAGRGSVRDRIRRIQAFISRNTPRN